MKRIAFEEHFLTQGYLDYLQTRQDYPRRVVSEDGTHKIEKIWYAPSCCFTMIDPDPVNGRLMDMGEGRLKEMDRTGIDMQVLMLQIPGVEPFNVAESIRWAMETNNALAEAVHRHPDRLAGLAALPVQDPAAAAAELERAVRMLGLRGANVNSHINGEYLDNKRYRPILAKAQELGVPIYIHPREPSPQMVKPYLDYPIMWGTLGGFEAEVRLHAMRLICSGVFDELPGLKIILGHMGEGLPFSIWRLDNKWRPTPMAKSLKKKPSEYVKDNFLITTSGMFSEPALMCSYSLFGPENILFAVDYPFESIDAAVKFMDSAPIKESDKNQIYYRNAEKLLGL